MIGNVAGTICTVYREQIWNNPSIYTTPVTDDFLINAVKPQAPLDTTRGLSPAYGSQQLVDSWIVQLRQSLIQR